MDDIYDDKFEDLHLEDRVLHLKEERWRFLMSMRLEKMAEETKRNRLHFEGIPRGWEGIENKYPMNPKKKRITAAFDEDVVKFFKATGVGYQAKMNEVLRVYMYARLSKYIEADVDRSLDGKLL